MKDPEQICTAHKNAVIGICLGVGALHFVTGPAYSGPFPEFVNGYLIDILLPFAMFLLLGVQNIQVGRRKDVRCALVLGIGFVSETLQFFGIPAFGRTFDPLDYVAFAFGVVLGFLIENLVFGRMNRFAESGNPIF